MNRQDDQYEEKLQHFIRAHNIQGEHLRFRESCHSVQEAAHAARVPVDSFVKNICMIDASGNLVVAIVKGEDRASTSNVAALLQNMKLRVASPEEILEKTGYPCGGTPSFGYRAQFFIDERVMEKEVVYSGGGSEKSLIKISPHELQRANSGKIAKIRR